MTQINFDLIQSLTKKREMEKMPFFGLRTGFLRAWVFVAFKVLIVASILHGSGLVKSFEDNIALLDQYYRNDFQVAGSGLAMQPRPHVKPENGTVASANTTAASGDATGNFFTPSYLPQMPIPGVTGIDLNYLNQLIQYNISSSINSGFVLGNGTSIRGCLVAKDDGIIYGHGTRCGTSGGGGGGGGTSGATSISNAAPGSVLFIDSSADIAQDNDNFFWDTDNQSLNIGTSTSVDSRLQIDAGTTTHTVESPTFAQGVINYGSPGYFNDGPYTHNIRVYAYKVVGSDTVYSPSYATLDADIVDNGAADQDYTITWSWDIVPGADGYRILKYDDWNGYTYDAGYDTTNNYFEDDACNAVCFDGGLADVSTTSLDTYDSAAITTTGFVGIGTTSPDALLSVGSSSEFQVDGAGTITSSTLSGSGSRCLQTDNNGVISIAAAACSSGGITIGSTTIASGTSGRVLYNNGGVLGQMTTTGSGTTLALSASPSFSGTVTAPTITVTSAINIPGDTRRGLAKVYDASIGDAFGFEQVSAAQTGMGAAAIRFFTAGNPGATGFISFGRYQNSSTTFGDYMTLNVGGGFSPTIDAGNGAAGPVLTIGRNANGTNTGAGSINFQSKSGTAGYVWQDNSGNMRINTSAPTNALDTSGTVIGTQASVRSAKQDIMDYTDYGAALQMVADAPLHTFRYIKEVEGYGSDSPLAKERIGFIADEVPGAFMWGNSIDQVSVNGILLASVKALNNKIDAVGASALPMGQPNLADTPIVLKSQLYLSGDSIGQAKILEGDTSVRVTFDKAYQYDPIVTVTPNGRVGSEYWVDDKDSTGFTIYIDDEANHSITFDWHAFASPTPKLSVSSGTSGGGSIEPEPSVEPQPDSEPTSDPGLDDGEVAGDSTPPAGDPGQPQTE